MSSIFDQLAELAENSGFEVETLGNERGEGSPEASGIRLIVAESDEDSRSRGSLVCRDVETAQFVFESDFQHYERLKSLDGIWSSSLDVIECGLDASGRPYRPLAHQLDLIARRLGLQGDREDGLRPLERLREVKIPSPRENLEIELGFCCAAFAVFRSLNRRGAPLRSGRVPPLPVLRIKRHGLEDREDVENLTKRLANSVLFQIDLLTNVSLRLARPIDPSRFNRFRFRVEGAELKAPEFEYDSDPMSLYWYARDASDMPLLRYLAFYQVVEFYFPRFSNLKVQEEIQRVLKDPRFNSSNLGDIARIVKLLKPNRSGRGVGDERSQLQSTIQACISPSEIRDFLVSDEELSKFFDRSGKRKMPIVPVSLSLKSEQTDLRPQVSERIYSIRCRIVHTKSDGDDQVLLPFSRESRLLGPDIELVQFVAQKVLIATSRRLSL